LAKVSKGGCLLACELACGLSKVGKRCGLLAGELACGLTKVCERCGLLTGELACGLTQVAVLSTALQNAGKIRPANAADRASQLSLTSKIAT
jgi:hypothetical protein